MSCNVLLDGSIVRARLSVVPGCLAAYTDADGVRDSSAVQVWLFYSSVTGYMLYACSAKKKIASRVPRLVRTQLQSSVSPQVLCLKVSVVHLQHVVLVVQLEVTCQLWSLLRCCWQSLVP